MGLPVSCAEADEGDGGWSDVAERPVRSSLTLPEEAFALANKLLIHAVKTVKTI